MYYYLITTLHDLKASKFVENAQGKCEIVVFSLEDVFFVFPAAFKTKDLDMVKIFL